MIECLDETCVGSVRQGREVMREVRVQIPSVSLVGITFRQQDVMGCGVLNVSLKSLNEREVFRWHLSLMIEASDDSEDSAKRLDASVASGFGEVLTELMTADSDTPNALFVGRLTWRGTCELIYRVHDPEVANDTLSMLVDAKDIPWPFTYRMDDDPSWALAAWHLAAMDTKASEAPSPD